MSLSLNLHVIEFELECDITDLGYYLKYHYLP